MPLTLDGDPRLISTARGEFYCRFYGVPDSGLQTSGAPCDPPPVLICVHGAGMSSASFGPVGSIMSTASAVEEHPFSFRAVAVDLRCHGHSTRDGGEAILSLDTLVEDFVEVVQVLKKDFYPHTLRFYYAGHSLGGSVVAFAATHKSIAPLLGGVVLLDIVEAGAKHSLQYMNGVLDKRPTSFSSTAEAAHWFVVHGGMFNESIAQLTVPYLLQKRDDDTYTWRTNLRATQPCWDTWFEGLDRKFVSLPCPKMLLLATTDRLDKELTLAQMQGKFQLEVIGTQGHYVMEDDPSVVASKLMKFVYRVETLSRKLPVFNKTSSVV